MSDKKVHDAQLDADEYTIGSEGGSFPYFHAGDVSENCQMEADASDVHLDSFKKRRTLEPRLWGDGMKLDSRARLKLLDIADDFWDFVSIDWVKPYGIFLTGSICNYNWSKYSDIDLHIVVEFDDVSEKYDFVRDYFNSKKAEWNEKHGGLSIYGYPIEVYVEDVDDETVSNGIYDLEANEWSTKPSMDKVKQIGLDKYAIKERAAKAMTHIDALEDKVRSTNDVAKLSDAADELSAFIEAIRSDRRKGLADMGEFSPSNIVYKVLRRSGYLDKAWSLQDELYDRINTIKESYDGRNVSRRIFHG